jgi:hypothetical protein
MGLFPRRSFYQVHLPRKILWKLTRRSKICLRSKEVISFWEILLKFCSLAMLDLPEIPKTYGDDGFRGIFYFFYRLSSGHDCLSGYSWKKIENFFGIFFRLIICVRFFFRVIFIILYSIYRIIKRTKIGGNFF